MNIFTYINSNYRSYLIYFYEQKNIESENKNFKHVFLKNNVDYIIYTIIFRLSNFMIEYHLMNLF